MVWVLASALCFVAELSVIVVLGRHATGPSEAAKGWAEERHAPLGTAVRFSDDAMRTTRDDVERSTTAA